MAWDGTTHYPKKKEPTDVNVEALAPALDGLKSDKLFKIRLTVGAQAIRLGLCRALIVVAPDDFPNCLVNFWDKNFGAHICYHLDVTTLKLVRPCDLRLPEPTRQPDDPIDVPCENGNCRNY